MKHFLRIQRDFLHANQVQVSSPLGASGALLLAAVATGCGSETGGN